MVYIPTHRSIPLSTRIGILFGGAKSQFGWAFLGFGMIFFWVFAMNADVSDYYFNDDIVETEGVAIRWQGTGASENEVPVYENHFLFYDDEGVEHESVSYATGYAVTSGESLKVEYPAGKPEYARIKGMRNSMFSSFVLFVVIFPLVGLIFILLGIRRSLRALRLLRNGVLTEGELIAKELTNTKVNKRPVYRMIFRYQDLQGEEYTRKERTHMPYSLQDQKKEKLLYLRSKPSFSIMLDSLPGVVEINDEGRVKAYYARNAVLLLICPLGTIIGHGIYLLTIYG
ncbi:MAG: DUF3592 domain-containing protein [Bacteroidales bacterium]|jgi:hypothetical protein|nr:DUF3592 domain-containing protein [Bacteroidales bacterium]